VFGEGYSIIVGLLKGQEEEIIERSLLLSYYHPEWFVVLFMLFVIFVKAFATGLTIGGGGSGGTFAPSLFVGGVFGYVFAKSLNLMGVAELSTANFAMVGMCGALCGIQYAPLTAIFLIAELTGGYSLFVPLMIVSAISYSTVTYFNTYSVYTRELVARGDIAIGDDDATVLNKLKLNYLVEKDVMCISPEAKLGDLIHMISKSRRNIFAVVDRDKNLVGVIPLDNVREIMFDLRKQESVFMTDLMEQPPAMVEEGEKMTSVMQKFESTQAWNLPVLKDGEYCGFISKSRIFGYYRKKLMETLT
jgi:CIC family chloride channel protein